jgi:hypothetical protein
VKRETGCVVRPKMSHLALRSHAFRRCDSPQRIRPQVQKAPNDPGQTRLVEGMVVEPTEIAEVVSPSGTGG